MTRTIVLVCSLDTKGEPAQYLRERITSKGYETIVLDINTGAEPAISADISAAEVVQAGGGDIKVVRASRQTSEFTPIVIRGAIAKVKELFEADRLHGVISFGGASNTIVATSVMKSLPFGIPKLMVSSTASMPAYAAKYIGTKDITMMHSVIDIAGLNDLARDVLERAAGGICGMVAASQGAVIPQSKQPLIAMTEFKFNEPCGHLVRDFLEQKGYEVISVHAQGIGDRAMEELIDQGVFDGVMDLVPAGVSEQLFGGNRAAGPTRLEAAGRRGIPQVIAPSGFEMLSCGPLERREQNDPLWTSRNLAGRKLFIPDEYRVEVSTNGNELREIAQNVAEKLNRSRGLAMVLVPTQGWSTLSVPGAALHEPEISALFAPHLRDSLRSEIKVRELETHINTPEFAQAATEALDTMMKQ